MRVGRTEHVGVARKELASIKQVQIRDPVRDEWCELVVRAHTCYHNAEVLSLRRREHLRKLVDHVVQYAVEVHSLFGEWPVRGNGDRGGVVSVATFASKVVSGAAIPADLGRVEVDHPVDGGVA